MTTEAGITFDTAAMTPGIAYRVRGLSSKYYFEKQTSGTITMTADSRNWLARWLRPWPRSSWIDPTGR